MVRDIMPCLIARTVTLLLAWESIAPEYLRDALFQDTPNLSTGGIVFYAYRQVAKSLSVQKSKALFSDCVTLVLDEALL